MHFAVALLCQIVIVVLASLTAHPSTHNLNLNRNHNLLHPHNHLPPFTMSDSKIQERSFIMIKVRQIHHRRALKI
jgi:hypothetical protein